MDGFLIINKPAGITSFDVIRHIRRKTGVKKVGHAGTLDPQATGVLIIAVGKATKLISRYEGMDKEYAATMTLGITTDSQDADGAVLSTRPVDGVTENSITKVVKSFVGEIEQIPPMVSAIKHKGLPLYKYARKGIEIERKSRKIMIREISNISVAIPEVSFLVKCSKGTYIRTLCYNIGEKLGCGAMLSKLVRTKVGPYSVEQALTLEQFDKLEDVNKAFLWK